MLDADEFLSDHGLRALSKFHEANPLHVSVDGVSATLDHEPGESTSNLFGNSNGRGPIRFPVNYLLVCMPRVYHGASHQTGWTGLVADLIVRRGRSWPPSLTGCDGPVTTSCRPPSPVPDADRFRA
jgi:hypothetical protein